MPSYPSETYHAPLCEYCLRAEYVTRRDGTIKHGLPSTAQLRVDGTPLCMGHYHFYMAHGLGLTLKPRLSLLAPMPADWQKDTQ